MRSCLLTALAMFFLSPLFSPAHAWVRGTQPFPQGEATVVLHRFCQGRECVRTVPPWPDLIQDAIDEWNQAGANFTFHTRPVRPGDDPCNLPGEVAIISVDPDTLCPGDGPLLDVHGPAGRTEYRLGGARVYIKDRPIPGPPTREDGIALTLLHELGHVVGLSHPDQYGQNVNAVMNSTNYFYRLQPDDIEGIQALYGRQDSSVGVLENPAEQSYQSGIGVLSGWVCEASGPLTVRFDNGDPLPVLYGNERADTRDTCGHADTGFVALMNWSLLSAGVHTAVVYDDGKEFSRNTFTVVSPGVEFLAGVTGSGTITLSNGQEADIVWSEARQGFVARAFTDPPRCHG